MPCNCGNKKSAASRDIMKTGTTGTKTTRTSSPIVRKQSTSTAYRSVPIERSPDGRIRVTIS